MSSSPDRSTILVVDDKLTNLQVMHHALTEIGYQVRVEADGYQAIAQVKSYPPDLILLDVMLPNINGFEICKQLKADPQTQDIPIIFMTALTNTEDKLTGLQAGAADYITKPFQQEEVLARIRLQLELRHLTKTLALRNQQLQLEVEERQQAETALQRLVAGTAAVTGQDFFPLLVENLASTLGVRQAMVTRFVGDRLETLAYWSDQHLCPNQKLPLELGVCQQTLQAGIYSCPTQLQAKFPNDTFLLDLQADSYLGVALLDAQQQAIGTLNIFNNCPIPDPIRFEAILRLFAARASAELDRQRALDALQVLNQDLETRVEQRTQALRQSQEYLRQLTENIASVFWMTDPDKRQVIYVSPAYHRIWGYSTQDLYNSPQQWLEAIHPDDQARVIAAIPKQVQGSYDEEYRIIRTDGEMRWIRDRAFPIYNDAGVIYRVAGIAEDITDQKQIEETLKLQERAIAASSNGIVIVDARLPDYPTLFVNPAFERITGYSASEVVGRNCQFLQDSDIDQPELLELRQALNNAQSCTVSLRNHRKDGSLFWNELSVSPIYDEQGKLTHYIGIQTEISDRKQAEEQLKASLHEKELLLKEIHHRVKNNLLVVASLLDWQTDYVEDPATLKIFEESQYRIQSMSLIHEKLYQSQNLDRIDIGEYLRTLSEHLIYSFDIDPQTIHFQFNLEPIFLNIETATPCGLIVNELISNSLEHAFPGQRSGQLWISVTKTSADQVTISIRDNGVGIPEEIDFQNTESLGLQLVCLLAKQVRGTLELHRDNGTEFCLTFTELQYQRRL